MKNRATDFSVSRMPPKSKKKLDLTKAREFKASKRQRVDSSNVASTSSELSSDQLPTFEELSFSQPSTLDEPFSSGELSSGQPPTSELPDIYLDTKLIKDLKTNTKIFKRI